VTPREKRKAYLGTRSYRRLSWRIAVLMAAGAVGSIILWVGQPLEIFPGWQTVAYWLFSWLIIWFVIRLLVRLTAGFISDERLMKHVHESAQGQ